VEIIPVSFGRRMSILTSPGIYTQRAVYRYDVLRASKFHAGQIPILPTSPGLRSRMWMWVWFLFSVRIRILDENDRFEILVSLPNLSLFFFLATRRTSLRKWEGAQLSSGCERCPLWSEGSAINDPVVQRDQWLVRATTCLVSKTKVGGGMDQRVARQQRRNAANHVDKGWKLPTLKVQHILRFRFAGLLSLEQSKFGTIKANVVTTRDGYARHADRPLGLYSM